MFKNIAWLTAMLKNTIRGDSQRGETARHREERGDDAIQKSRAPLDRFAALAMTGSDSASALYKSSITFRTRPITVGGPSRNIVS
jgi:hypothetical protein